jgi:hypothetical protein
MRVGAILRTVVVVLAKGSSERLIALALLFRGADSIVIAIALTPELDMTVMFKEGV